MIGQREKMRGDNLNGVDDADKENEINGRNGDKDNGMAAAKKMGDDARKEGTSLYGKDKGKRNGDDDNEVNEGSSGQGEKEGTRKDHDTDEEGQADGTEMRGKLNVVEDVDREKGTNGRDGEKANETVTAEKRGDDARKKDTRLNNVAGTAIIR